jgi:cell division protein FtsL
MQTALRKGRVEFYGGKQRTVKKKKAIKKRAKSKALNFVVVAVFFGVFISSCLFYTWAHMQVVHISYELAQAKKLESEYLENNKKLKTEIATLKTPLRIKQLARSRLGLSIPKKEQVIIIK